MIVFHPFSLAKTCTLMIIISLSEYNNLSSSLREYLRKFAESKKVVRDEDIREFFSQLAANKKQKPNSGVQLFCR